MKNLKYIKSFRFGYARYHLDNGDGDKILLRIDYWNNKFEIVSKGTKIDELFRSEVQKMAADLLLRKHGVNFARKLE